MPKPVGPGLVRTLIPVAASDAAQFTGTGAVNIVASMGLGFRCWLESLAFLTQTVGATAGSQIYRLRKGGVTGTIIGGFTLALANVDAVGEWFRVNNFGTPDACFLSDTDTFSITRDAGGTAFGTAPTGLWYVTIAQNPQVRR